MYFVIQLRGCLIKGLVLVLNYWEGVQPCKNYHNECFIYQIVKTETNFCRIFEGPTGSLTTETGKNGTHG